MRKINEETYYLTTGAYGQWQVRVAAYPSTAIVHTAATAVDAHIWAERHGYIAVEIV